MKVNSFLNDDLDEIMSLAANASLDDDESLILDADKKSTKEIFNNEGASLENAARTAAKVMNFGANDLSKLKAAELILKVHEVFKDMDREGPKAPQIQINIVSSGSINLNTLLTPNPVIKLKEEDIINV